MFCILCRQAASTLTENSAFHCLLHIGMLILRLLALFRG